MKEQVPILLSHHERIWFAHNDTNKSAHLPLCIPTWQSSHIPVWLHLADFDRFNEYFDQVAVGPSPCVIILPPPLSIVLRISTNTHSRNSYYLLCIILYAHASFVTICTPSVLSPPAILINKQTNLPPELKVCSWTVRSLLPGRHWNTIDSWRRNSRPGNQVLDEWSTDYPAASTTDQKKSWGCWLYQIRRIHRHCSQ